MLTANWVALALRRSLLLTYPGTIPACSGMSGTSRLDQRPGLSTTMTSKEAMEKGGGVKAKVTMIRKKKTKNAETVDANPNNAYLPHDP